MGRSTPSADSGPESRSSSPRTPGPRRRRDRRGRGLRGQLIPQGVPAWRSRADRFDDLVLDAVEHLENQWAAQLEGVEFAVEDVPPSDPSPWEHGEVPLGRFFPSQGELPPRIVVYRRPVETRVTDRRDVAALVADIVTEQVAGLLGVSPEELDPGFGE